MGKVQSKPASLEQTPRVSPFDFRASTQSITSNTTAAFTLPTFTLDRSNTASPNRSQWSCRSSRLTLNDLTRRFRRTFHCQPAKSPPVDVVTSVVPEQQQSPQSDSRIRAELFSFSSSSVDSTAAFRKYSSTSIDLNRCSGQVARCNGGLTEPQCNTFHQHNGEANRTNVISSTSSLVSHSTKTNAEPDRSDQLCRTSASNHRNTSINDSALGLSTNQTRTNHHTETCNRSWSTILNTAAHFDTHMPWSASRDRPLLARLALAAQPSTTDDTQIGSITPVSAITSTPTSSARDSATETRLASINIPPLINRTHTRASPYERLSRLSYTADFVSHRPSVRTHSSLKSTSGSPPNPQSVGGSLSEQSLSLNTHNEIVAADTTTATTTTPQAPKTCTASTQIAPRVTLVSSSIAFCRDPVSPTAPFASSVGRPRLQTEYSLVSGCSLASDDLMLDTDEGWTDGPDQEEDEDCHAATESKEANKSPAQRAHVFSPVSREPTRLESVTELSFDDLSTIPARQSALPLVEETTTSGGTDAQTNGVVLRRKKSTPPQAEKPVVAGSAMNASKIDQRRHTTSFTDTGIRTMFSGLRRLRSIPGNRFRSSSTSSGTNDRDDLGFGTHLGERTCVLLASEQRQMLQEIQGVKLTLLKLKRLLSEDQWHIPLFHEQLNMTEPSTRRRSRQPLPREWLPEHSDHGSTHETPAQRSRTCSDSGVAPAPHYCSSLTGSSDEQMGVDATGDRYSDLLQSDSAPLSPDSTGLSKLMVNLAQLQKENRQLYIQTNCA